nr:hypothetical protein [Desulfovibrio sp.]
MNLALFAWLLTLHPAASGRVYAAYGCVYVGTSGSEPPTECGCPPRIWLAEPWPCWAC